MYIIPLDIITVSGQWNVFPSEIKKFSNPKYSSVWTKSEAMIANVFAPWANDGQVDNLKDVE